MTKTYDKRPPKEVYDDTILNFGKFVGKSISHIRLLEKSYFDWLLKENIIVYKGKTKPIINTTLEPTENETDERKRLRIWSSGYLIMASPSDATQILNFN